MQYGKIFLLPISFIILLSTSVSSNAASVTVIESFNPLFDTGEYTVHNNSGQNIYALFVGNETATGADKGPNPVLEGWKPAIVSRTQWESGTIDFPSVAPQLPPLASTQEPDQGLESPDWIPPDTTQLSWDSLIGVQYTQAVGYWADGFGEVIPQPLVDGSLNDGFLFYSLLPASPFVTFGFDGGVVAQGHASVVPVPASVWLFGSALLGLAGIKRRST